MLFYPEHDIMIQNKRKGGRAMEGYENPAPRPINPRRRRRTKMDIFKEAYLPTVIVALTVIFIAITIIGAVTQNNKRQEIQADIQQSAVTQTQEDTAKLNAEADKLIKEAQAHASGYYYDEAIAVLNKFSGDITKFPKINDLLKSYQDIKAKMVAWEDPAKVLNLSFHVLIEDAQRAYADYTYGRDYNRNFITTAEFRTILDQLYSKGYVLVNMEDLVSVSQDGKTFKAKTLHLPAGKKPLILTQTHVNYYIYMTDGPDADYLPDKDGAGFASKLIVDGNGKLLNQMIDKDGKLITGEFDLVPILNSFIEKHPDFSYQGAKAVIAVTGDEGVFGYRTNLKARENPAKYLSDTYAKEVEGAKQVAQALRDSGYKIACYTYANKPYGDIGIATLKEDLNNWKEEVTPILGNVDTLVFARESDLSKSVPYSGEKFDALMDFGFRYYLGYCVSGKPYATVQSTHFQQNRLMVTGAYLQYNTSWFDTFLTPSEILSDIRGTIPKP